MNLSERLKSAPKRIPNGNCRLSKWIDTLSADDQTAVWEAIHNREWSIAALETELNHAGCPVGRNSISHHRNGLCRTCGESV